jgi:hypothetical protein
MSRPQSAAHLLQGNGTRSLLRGLPLRRFVLGTGRAQRTCGRVLVRRCAAGVKGSSQEIVHSRLMTHTGVPLQTLSLTSARRFSCCSSFWRSLMASFVASCSCNDACQNTRPRLASVAARPIKTASAIIGAAIALAAPMRSSARVGAMQQKAPQPLQLCGPRRQLFAPQRSRPPRCR